MSRCLGVTVSQCFAVLNDACLAAERRLMAALPDGAGIGRFLRFFGSDGVSMADLERLSSGLVFQGSRELLVMVSHALESETTVASLHA